MKSLTNVLLAVMLLAVGFALGWSVRSSYNPVVTVQMGPLERSWFMPVGALANSKDACAIVSAFRAAGRDVPTGIATSCAREIDSQLNHAVTTPLLIPASK